MAKRATSSGGGGGKVSGATPEPGLETRAMILHGKDPFLRTVYTERLRENLLSAGVEAEVLRYDGASAGVADVLDECRTLGLMQQHKIVVVDEADVWLKDKEEDATRARDLVERYLAGPSESATLVLRAETWRKGKVDKLVESVGCVVKCDALGEGEAMGWAIKRAKKRYGVELDRAAAGSLVSLCGTELGRLDTEIAKLSSACEGGTIDAALVREMVGYSREQTAWVIQEALLSGDGESVVGLLRDLTTVSRVAWVPIRYSMMEVARKLHAGARMREAGASAGVVVKELNVWGGMKDGLLDAVGRCSGAEAAAALRMAVEADRAGKTGLGDETRMGEVTALGLVRVVSGGR